MRRKWKCTRTNVRTNVRTIVFSYISLSYFREHSEITVLSRYRALVDISDKNGSFYEVTNTNFSYYKQIDKTRLLIRNNNTSNNFIFSCNDKI